MSKKTKNISKKKKQKILVYGITGLLGTRIGQLLSNKFDIIGPPHSLLDLTDKKKVYQNLFDTEPDQIVYCAGVTRVDQAELNNKLAFDTNCKAIDFIAKNAAVLNIPVCYISTDAIFDGKQKNKPYKEFDIPNPISVYGKSKLAGEKSVLNASNRNTVVRTIMIYSANFPHKLDFARVAYNSLRDNQYFEGIVDQYVNPTFVDDLVMGIEEIITNKASGIYHVAATDCITNYEFAKKIAKKFNFDTRLLKKVYFEDFFKDKPAPRSQYSCLDTKRFQKKFGKNILKSIDKSLTQFKKQIEAQGSSPVKL